jgi:hypothetical protein
MSVEQMQAQHMQQMQQMQQMQAQAMANAQNNPAMGVMNKMGMGGAGAGPGGVMGGLTKKFGIVGAVVGALVIAALGIGLTMLKSRFMPEKGWIKWSQIGADFAKADGDKMIFGVKATAVKWNRDAAFWSVNFQAVRADGTVDCEKGAEVQYFSPSKVASAAQSIRKDSIKKFHFSTKGANFKDMWGASKPWKDVVAPDVPACGMKQLMAEVTKTTPLPAGKTVRVSYSPKWEYASPVEEQAWQVSSDSPKLQAWYSMANCKLLLSK